MARKTGTEIAQNLLDRIVVPRVDRLYVWRPFGEGELVVTGIIRSMDDLRCTRAQIVTTWIDQDSHVKIAARAVGGPCENQIAEFLLTDVAFESKGA